MRRLVAALVLVALAPAGAVAPAEPGGARADATLVPDLSGRWEGTWWGVVVLRRDGDGYAGTYTDTYGKDVGRLRLWFDRRTGRFEGVWWEGRYRFGRLRLSVAGGRSAEGCYGADPGCELRPGWPATQAFRWVRVAE